MTVWILVVSFAITMGGELVGPTGMSSGMRSQQINTFVIDNIASKEACETLAGNLISHVPESRRSWSCVSVSKVVPTQQKE